MRQNNSSPKAIIFKKYNTLGDSKKKLSTLSHKFYEISLPVINLKYILSLNDNLYETIIGLQ